MPNKMTYDERIAKADKLRKVGENKKAIYQLEKAMELEPSKAEEMKKVIAVLDGPEETEKESKPAGKNEIWFIITKHFSRNNKTVYPGKHKFPPEFEEPFRRGKLGYPKK